jgi:hypothetical protein
MKQKGGYHQADLDALQQQMLALSMLVPLAAFDRIATVGLEHVLDHCKFPNHASKAALLVAYLEGRLQSVGRTGQTTADIQLRREDVRAFVAKGSAASADHSLSQQEASRRIDCDPQAIRVLIERGLLTKATEREGIRVTRESVANFAAQYRSLSSLAHQRGTSSRRLTRVCAGAGIPTLRIPRNTKGGDIPFLAVEFVNQVLPVLRA